MGMLHYGYFLIAQNKSIYSSTETHVDWTKTFGTILFTPFRNSSNFIVGWNSTTTDTIFWGSRFIWIGGCSWNLRCSFFSCSFSLFGRTFSLCRCWLSWWSWIIIVGAKSRRKIIFWNSRFFLKKITWAWFLCLHMIENFLAVHIQRKKFHRDQFPSYFPWHKSIAKCIGRN